MSENAMDPDEQSSSGISRRDVLRRGAIVGGAAFMVPAVQSISMSRAAAQTTSVGGGGGGGAPAPGNSGDPHHRHHHHHWWDW
jgi:hypothetical protein